MQDKPTQNLPPITQESPVLPVTKKTMDAYPKALQHEAAVDYQDAPLEEVDYTEIAEQYSEQLGIPFEDMNERIMPLAQLRRVGLSKELAKKNQNSTKLMQIESRVPTIHEVISVIETDKQCCVPESSVFRETLREEQLGLMLKSQDGEKRCPSCFATIFGKVNITYLSFNKQFMISPSSSGKYIPYSEIANILDSAKDKTKIASDILAYIDDTTGSVMETSPPYSKEENEAIACLVTIACLSENSRAPGAVESFRAVMQKIKNGSATFTQALTSENGELPIFSAAFSYKASPRHLNVPQTINGGKIPKSKIKGAELERGLLQGEREQTTAEQSLVYPSLLIESSFFSRHQENLKVSICQYPNFSTIYK
ncbi:MAG: hypothetical protein WCW01_07155 [Gammaproteobacteria bacterium]